MIATGAIWFSAAFLLIETPDRPKVLRAKHMATCEFEGSFHEAYTPRKQCSRSSPPVFMDNQTDAGYGRFCPVPPTFETIIDGKKVELQHPRPLTPPPCIRSCRTVKVRCVAHVLEVA